ncbi:36320_t:CDS:2, partial [Gigaspora margarita]
KWEFTDNRNNEHNDDKSLSDEDKEYEYNYGIIIKLANGTTIPAKCIQPRRSIESSNYLVTFKHEKATGADNDAITNFKNKNSISKASNLSPNESLIAKNVLEIRKKNHYLIHNQPCLNKNSDKKNHIEITFMMLSIWASEINKAMASPTELPMHPIFAYKHQSKKRQSLLPSSILSLVLHSELLQESSPSSLSQATLPLAPLQILSSL